MSFPFTAQDIVEAYRETGLYPRRGILLGRGEKDGEWVRCGCAAGVMAAKRCGSVDALAERFRNETTEHYERRELVTSVLGISNDQYFGLADGFDGASLSVSLSPESDEAYAVGREAARLVGLTAEA